MRVRRGDTATHSVEGEDGAQLNEAVEGHVSEETEGGDQGTSALSARTRGKDVLSFLALHMLFHNNPGSVGFHSFLTSKLETPPTSSPDEKRHTGDVVCPGGER